MADLNINDIQAVIREEIDPLKTDVTELKTDVADLKTEQRRQGVLLEDMDDNLQTALENLSDNLKIKSQVSDHEERITNIGASQDILKSTIKLHTEQLKSS
ncbi:MAG: hypothetical protein ACREGF_03015 [Candidatus Saccharimonadales bacterium]